jgi:hypothetical protein
MTSEYKRKTGIRVGVGVGLEILSRFLLTGGDPLQLFALIVCLVGVLVFIWGVGAGTKGDRREFKRRQVIWQQAPSLGRGVEEA